VGLEVRWCLWGQVRLYETEHEGEAMTVARASKLLANRLARYVIMTTLYISL
jgi:hypothetical protein